LAGFRPGHGTNTAGTGLPIVHLPRPGAFKVIQAAPPPGTGTAGPASKFGDLKLSGIKLSQSGAFKVIQAEIPPGGIGTATAGTGPTGTGTAGTTTGTTGTGTTGTGTGNAGTAPVGMGNGGMGRGPRFPGTVIVTNSYPDAQYVRVHRDYGWYGQYPTTVAPVIARPIMAAAPSCLSKEYLQQGVVMFRDTCTKEWAINKTSTQTASNAACLTKVNPQDGVVMFKDICSSEWAMNPAQAPDQAQN
jgi:hypothetical protein